MVSCLRSIGRPTRTTPAAAVLAAAAASCRLPPHCGWAAAASILWLTTTNTQSASSFLVVSSTLTTADWSFRTRSSSQWIRGSPPLHNSNIFWSSDGNKNRHAKRMTTTVASATKHCTAEENEEDPTITNRLTSKTLLRVALCQFPVTSDKETNWQTCADFIDRAVATTTTTTTTTMESSSTDAPNDSKPVDLVVLPEIWNAPYATAAFEAYAEILPNMDTETPNNTNLSPSAALLRAKAMQHQIYIVGGSIPERDVEENEAEKNITRLYNTCLVYAPNGDLVAKHRKMHLFDIDVPGGIVFRESDTLSPGSNLTSFDTPWCRIGVGICYDIRFPEYAQLLTQPHRRRSNDDISSTDTPEGCKVLIYPGAFNMVTGPAHWELLQRGRAVDNQCFVLTASPSRSAAPSIATDSDAVVPYPHYTAWGHSTAVGPWGNVLATTDETPGIVVADLDLTAVDDMRRSIPVRNQKRSDLYQLVEGTISNANAEK